MLNYRLPSSATIRGGVDGGFSPSEECFFCPFASSTELGKTNVFKTITLRRLKKAAIFIGVTRSYEGLLVIFINIMGTKRV